jgi:glyoxylase-like metal-dependent hydrolase (beta-lactamase superfamily II)
MTAQVDVLTDGYAGDRVASTVTLIRDGSAAIVVDPGMVARRGAILDPLAALGVQVGDVTDVVFSHHHPDHTLNAALFPAARFHDFWAIYQDDRWDQRDADGFQVSPAVRMMATPCRTSPRWLTPTLAWWCSRTCGGMPTARRTILSHRIKTSCTPTGPGYWHNSQR